jgi:hypothetical protein
MDSAPPDQERQQQTSTAADPAAGGQTQSWQAGSGESLPAEEQAAGPAASEAAKSTPEVSPYRNTGTLQDKDKLELLEMRNQFIKEQAEKGTETGLSLVKDKEEGHNKQETWGMQPSRILGPDDQN